jgi:hypothetical protein
MMAILTSFQPWILLTGLAVDLLAGLQLGVGHLDHALQGGPNQPEQLETLLAWRKINLFYLLKSF